MYNKDHPQLQHTIHPLCSFLRKTEENNPISGGISKRVNIAAPPVTLETLRLFDALEIAAFAGADTSDALLALAARTGLVFTLEVQHEDERHDPSHEDVAENDAVL